MDEKCNKKKTKDVNTARKEKYDLTLAFYRTLIDKGDIFYIKIDKSSGTTEDWHYLKIIPKAGLIVKIIPRLLKVTIVQIASQAWMWNDIWLWKVRLIDKSIFDRRIDDAVKKLNKYKEL